MRSAIQRAIGKPSPGTRGAARAFEAHEPIEKPFAIRGTGFRGHRL